jgi:GAF domain-containing protein
MKYSDEELQADIEKVKHIPIVDTMLEVICRTTEMGFAAIARVTEDKWIACGVRDEINFGLVPGGELEIKSTICNEIRDSRKPVIIDHVEQDEQFCNHHTPKQYGFQSYISVPIILNTGEFFGTLCAIDPKPAKVSDPKITGMFKLFAQLIAFHLQAVDLIDSSNVQLNEARQENKRYEHLTYHSLREPLRKISLYSDMLVQEDNFAEGSRVKNIAADIHRFSQELATMLRKLNV